MPHTLLLADDSVTIQRVIELTFADEDVQIVAVSDGDEAIARIEASPPDIVLADVAMTGKNGYEVAQYVKDSPRLAHIPVILLTGAFEPVDQARAAATGCEGVLAKPFEPQLVIGRVKDLLAKGHRAEAPASHQTPAIAEPSAPAASPRHAFWPPAPIAPPSSPALGETAKTDGDLDSYFDRLDEAFANFGAPALEPPASAAPPSAPASGDSGWFGTISTPSSTAPVEHRRVDTPPASTSTDVPLSYASPLAEFDRLPELPSAASDSEIALGANAPAPGPAMPAPESSQPWTMPDVTRVQESTIDTPYAEQTTTSGFEFAATPPDAFEGSHQDAPVASESSSIPEPHTPAPAEHIAAPVPTELAAPAREEHAAAPAPEEHVAAPVPEVHAAVPVEEEHVAPPAPEQQVATPAPTHAAASVAPRPPAAPQTSAALPPLADAFAALLAAEQNESSGGSIAWPSSAPITEISEEVLEQIARRVLERLSDQVVRETISGLVSTIAERLVREEIERIKNAVQ